MTKIKLALCQMNVIDNKEANIEKATSMINDSTDNNADFIVFLKISHASRHIP